MLSPVGHVVQSQWRSPLGLRLAILRSSGERIYAMGGFAERWSALIGTLRIRARLLSCVPTTAAETGNTFYTFPPSNRPTVSPSACDLRFPFLYLAPTATPSSDPNVLNGGFAARVFLLHSIVDFRFSPYIVLEKSLVTDH